jgi:hypothetical protein
MEPEKELINKDLADLNEQEFTKSITNNFVDKDHIEQLEWAMLMIQSKFQQMKLAPYLPMVTANHFDKSYLIGGSLKDNLMFFRPFTDLQANPEMFPELNIKIMIINDSIQLIKVKEMDLKTRRNLQIKRRYGYEVSTAVFKKDTESFYGIKQGFELNDGFFKLLDENRPLQISDLPNPVSLHPGYTFPKNAIMYFTKDVIANECRTLAMSYQVAMSMYYEWCIYLKEYDNIGLIIPIEPSILSEIYKTSLLKFDTTKRMLHFVKEHYRRKIALPNEDYSIFVNKYLRGEYKFDYRGFYAEIIPPKYDLNRVKTRKKFIDATA